MKRLLLLVFVLVVLASPAWAGGLLIGSGVTASGGDCSTEVTAETFTSGANPYNIGGTRYAFAGQWTASESYALCKVEATVYKIGTPGGTLTVKIYEDNGSDLPGTLLGTSTTNLGAADVTISAALYFFYFSSSININSGTKYWLSLEYTGTLNTSHEFMTVVNTSLSSNKTATYVSSWSAFSNSTLNMVKFK